jgi:hemolysin D
MIAATLVVLFLLALGWASIGTVDIVATAPGEIAPTGRSKVVQPLEIGVVRAIHVQDGQMVKAGDPLIELDTTNSQAEEDHLRSDLASAQLDVARLQAALANSDNPAPTFKAPAGASATLVASQRQLLLSENAEQVAKIAALDRQRAQKEAERATASAEIAKIEALVPILQQQVDVRQTLMEHATGSKLSYLQVLQQLVDQQQQLLVQKSRYNEADASLAVIAQTRAQIGEEYRHRLLDDLTKAQAKAAGLQQDLVKASERNRLQLLTAPVDGVVQQLAVHTIGGVVTPAQPLLVVVPADNRLEIEARVSNQDIGFVEPGQEAEIKVETFNFTRYGLLHGRVLSISRDAIAPGATDDRSRDKAQGNGSDSAPSRSQEPVYAARISLDRTQMMIEGKPVNLSPGMAVTAEIRTGQRRIISYLLSPLRAYRQDSLRER